MLNQPRSDAPELQKALRLLRKEIFEGLRHGFFELTVSGETINGGKRRMTISSGRSYQFTIPEDSVRD